MYKGGCITKRKLVRLYRKAAVLEGFFVEILCCLRWLFRGSLPGYILILIFRDRRYGGSGLKFVNEIL